MRSPADTGRRRRIRRFWDRCLQLSCAEVAIHGPRILHHVCTVGLETCEVSTLRLPHYEHWYVPHIVEPSYGRTGSLDVDEW